MSMIKNGKKKKLCISADPDAAEGRELLKQAMVEPIKIDIGLKDMISEENIELLKKVFKEAPSQKARSSLMQRDLGGEQKEYIIEECPESKTETPDEHITLKALLTKLDTEIERVHPEEMGTMLTNDNLGQEECCAESVCDVEDKAVFEALAAAVKQPVEPEVLSDEPQECCQEGQEEVATQALDELDKIKGSGTASGLYGSFHYPSKWQIPDKESTKEELEAFIKDQKKFLENISELYKNMPGFEWLQNIELKNTTESIKENNIATTAPGFYSPGEAGQTATAWTPEVLEEKAKSKALQEAFDKMNKQIAHSYEKKLAEKLADAKDVDVPQFIATCNSIPSAWQEPDKTMLEQTVAEKMSEEEITKKVEELEKAVQSQWIITDKHILPVKIQKIDKSLDRTVSSDLYEIPERKTVPEEKEIKDAKFLELSLVKEENLLDPKCKIQNDIISSYIYRLTLSKEHEGRPLMSFASLCRGLDDMLNQKDLKQEFKHIIFNFDKYCAKPKPTREHPGPKIIIARLSDDKYKEFIFEEAIYIYYEQDIKTFLDFMKKHDVPFELIDKFLDIYYETRISDGFEKLIECFEERKEFNLIDGPEDEVSVIE